MDKIVRIWDVASGKLLRQFKHDNIVNSVSFTPNHNQLITTTHSGTGYCWDTTNLDRQCLEFTTFTYDNNGNPSVDNINANPQTYTYDNENRLTKVVWANRTATSTYTQAGDGLRRTKQENGTTLTTIIWDGDEYLMEKS